MQIAELKFGDVGRGLGHYRPVALAVGAIVVMGLAMPGPRRVALDDFGASRWTSSAAAVVPSAVGDSELPAEASAAFEAIESAPSAGSSTFSSPFSAPASTSSSFTSDAFVTREASSESASSTFDSSTPSATRTETTSTASGPLRITRSAWASGQAGTPLAATGVPEGGLPVGRRPGFELDKVAFVKLAGGASTLKLLPHDDTSGARNAEGGVIQACRITSPGWAEASGQSIEEAPAWDCGVAVQGVRADDGSWTFDLSVFDDRADDRGFALVPAGSALDFQVTFLPG